MLPLIAGSTKLKAHIFVVDKDTADLISKYFTIHHVSINIKGFMKLVQVCYLRIDIGLHP